MQTEHFVRQTEQYFQERNHKMNLVNQRTCPRPSKRLNSWGAALRRFRRDRGWSQEELTERVQRAGWNVSRVVLFRIESGDRQLLDYEAEFLLRVLGRTLGDLAAEVR